MSELSATTILVEIVTAEGTAAWHDPWAGPGIRTRQATPPATFGQHIDGNIAVTINHDGPHLGYLDYVEHHLGHGMGAMYGVATIKGVPYDLVDGLVMCSPEIVADAIAETVNTDKYTNATFRSSAKVVGTMHASHAKLVGVALVDSTAGDTVTRVRAWDGDYLGPLDRSRWNRPDVPEILRRAIAAAPTSLRWNRPERLRVHQPPPDYGSTEDRNERSARPSQMRVVDGRMTEINYHDGGYVLGVRSPG